MAKGAPLEEKKEKETREEDCEFHTIVAYSLTKNFMVRTFGLFNSNLAIACTSGQNNRIRIPTKIRLK